GDQQEAPASPDPAPAAPQREAPPAEPARTGGYEVVPDHRFDAGGAGSAPEPADGGVPGARRQRRPPRRGARAAAAPSRWLPPASRSSSPAAAPRACPPWSARSGRSPMPAPTPAPSARSPSGTRRRWA